MLTPFDIAMLRYARREANKHRRVFLKLIHQYEDGLMTDDELLTQLLLASSS